MMAAAWLDYPPSIWGGGVGWGGLSYGWGYKVVVVRDVARLLAPRLVKPAIVRLIVFRALLLLASVITVIPVIRELTVMRVVFGPPLDPGLSCVLSCILLILISIIIVVVNIVSVLCLSWAFLVSGSFVILKSSQLVESFLIPHSIVVAQFGPPESSLC